MTLEDQVRQARTPLDALLLLARRLDQLAAPASLNAWNGWGDPSPAAPPSDPSPVAPPEPAQDISEDEVRAWIAKNYGRVPADDAEGRAIIAQVRKDLIHAPNEAQVKDLFRQTADGVIESDIDWAPLSEEHRAGRHRFAETVLQLDTALGPHPTGGDWAADYASGGPMWFYIPYRDLVMQYPKAVRAAMVEDIQLYGNEKVTQEFGGDILKEPMSTDREHGAPAPLRLGEEQL